MYLNVSTKSIFSSVYLSVYNLDFLTLYVLYRSHRSSETYFVRSANNKQVMIDGLPSKVNPSVTVVVASLMIARKFLITYS